MPRVAGIYACHSYDFFLTSERSLEDGLETRRKSALALWIQYITAVRHL